MHFFSTRSEGDNRSAKDISWRYGKGNVFFPESLPAEEENVRNNISALLAHHMPSVSRSVLLAAQYGAGIAEVDEAFLSTADDAKPIVFKGDGLFTTLPNIGLLNKSGDAHAIVFESPSASAILVGSWRCIKEGIFEKMIVKFLERGIDPKDIRIQVGPGLGANSYSLNQEVYDALNAEMPPAISDAIFQKKPLKPGKPQKYVLNFPELIIHAAKRQGIEAVIGSTSENTFDKHEWKSVKDSSTPEQLMSYYASRPYFSARLFTRVVRQINRVCEKEGLALPPGVETLSLTNYGSTGRCLNGVALSADDFRHTSHM